VPNGAVLKSQISNPKSQFSNLQSPISNLHSPFCVLLYTRFFEFQAERVLEVFERVAAEVPEVKFLIVGAGLSGEEEELLCLASQRGLADRIVYTGWVEATELPGYLAAAAVAIYPLDDNLLNRARCSAKLVDLMAAGLAIVAEDVGQTSEYIEHGRSGLLVEAGDTEVFVQYVVRLLRDKSLRGVLGNEAQRRVCEEFAWEKLVESIESAYHRKGDINE
jgi:glycosyltransferase involved in cell wall biosynthesis